MLLRNLCHIKLCLEISIVSFRAKEYPKNKLSQKKFLRAREILFLKEIGFLRFLFGIIILLKFLNTYFKMKLIFFHPKFILKKFYA
ncbi:hypothetical protein BGP_6535 [Beggiatoa sp. PS]|nr:hypothetical protein BGP_6535 [Beggiatoa sp. PS]